jgi:hypothetical protein
MAGGITDHCALPDDKTTRRWLLAEINHRRTSCRLHELIIIFVAADPHPFNDVAHQPTDRPMMIAYTDREAVAFAALKLFEVERWMTVIALPKLVTPSRARLNMRR